MEMKALLFLIGCLIYGCQAQAFYSCGYLMTLNCTTFPVAEVCATNGVTYRNRCAFGQEHCSLLELHIKYEKACDPWDFTTTPHPTAGVGPTVAAGDDVILDIFCAYLPYAQDPVCPGQGVVVDLICGTDGITYENFCEYEKAKCTHRDLHVVSWGNCTN